MIQTQISLSVGYDITSKLKEGTPPGELDTRIWTQSWKDYRHASFGKTISVEPNQAKYVYVWSRPRAVHFTEFFEWCDTDGCYSEPTNMERYEVRIEDLYIRGITIQGGDRFGLPDQRVMDWIYSDEASHRQQLQIPGTSLENGKLDPGEDITIPDIMRWFDECGVDFEVSIPIGAMAAAAVTALSGGMLAWAAPFLAAFSLNIHYGDISAIIVDGLLQNDGSYPHGYNVYERLYMRVSNVRYVKYPPWWCFWCETCEYEVPTSMYFRSE